VKSLHGRTWTLDVKGSDTIYSLKNQLLISDGIPIDMQRLICHGKQLEDNKTLNDYVILKESTIHFVERLRGDIGVFGCHEGSYGREYLNGKQEPSKEQVEELVRKYKGEQNS